MSDGAAHTTATPAATPAATSGVTPGATTGATAPELAGFDIFDPDQAGRKWDLLAAARRDHPVFRTDEMGGMWVVTRYEDVRYVLENPLLFSSRMPSILPNPICMAPIDVDPPLHRDFRTVINPYLSRSYLTRFVASMRRIVVAALDGFLADGRCEFDSAFGVPVTSKILAQVVFDETDPDRLHRAVDAATRMGLHNTPDTFVDMAQACAEFLAEREQAGGGRDDLLGALLRAEVDGRPLTREERLGVVTVLFVGGLDTTRAALANILVHLCRDPDLERRVRDPRGGAGRTWTSSCASSRR